MKLYISLLRCGQTKSGEHGRLLGLRDEPLSEKGREELHRAAAEKNYPEATLVYTGEMLRCRETATILYPHAPAVILRELKPFDYGELEGKAEAELQSDKRFLKWIWADSLEPCPGGEDPFMLQARSTKVFRNITDEMDAKGIEEAAVITHKAVICTIMQRYGIPRSLYQNWMADHGCGYRIEYDTASSSAKVLLEI